MPSKKKVFAVIFGLAALGISIFVVHAILSNQPEVVEIPIEETLPSKHTIIGTSVEKREIEAYTYGNGEQHVLFVGGMHGGYEWNTVVLAYTFIDYLRKHPGTVPKNLTISVIPDLNPDGTYAVIEKEGRFTVADTPPEAATVPGRFNAHDVDLNRNFDCKWQLESSWRGETVSAGTSPFSEPETATLRDFVLTYEPDMVVFWHSQGNAVYASECENGILPETLTLMNTYANASGYTAIPSFDAYPITGDAEGWLASIGIPAITVELSTHETIEWEQNLAGIQALLGYYEHK